MREVWCAVGTPTGLRSTVWKIWTHAGSAYLQSRMMGNSTKVSLHPSGEAQFSMTSTWYGVNRPNQTNQGRHFQRWQWHRPTDGSAEHVFTLSIPASELRVIPTTQDLAKVRWLPCPGPGQRADLRCFVAPIASAQTASERTDFIALLDLDSETSFVLLLKLEEMAASDLTALESARNDVSRIAKAQDVTVGPEVLGAVLFHYESTGVRCMFEVVPAS
jgi:hypothetical protein